MPDVAAGLQFAGEFVIRGHLDARENALGSGDLIRPHDQQEVLRGEDTVTGENIQQGVFGEEGLREVDQVRDDGVVGIGLVAGEFEAVTGLLGLVDAA